MLVRSGTLVSIASFCLRCPIRSPSITPRSTMKLGDQPNLQLPRVLGIPLATPLGCVTLDVRTQGAILLAPSVILENLLHHCSPSGPAWQENTARTMPGKSAPKHCLP